MYIQMKKQQTQTKRYSSVQAILNKHQQAQQLELTVIAKLDDQNRMLRKKLKMLNYKLDDEIEKAAQEKIKQATTPKSPGKTKNMEVMDRELKNAYKMIDRLQKTVKEYQSKEGYNNSVSKIMDLEDVIRKKDKQLDELKLEIKTLKKIGRQHEKIIEESNENNKRNSNPAEDKEEIHRLREKTKKLFNQNDSLHRENRKKHERIIVLEKKVQELETELEQQKVPQDQTSLQQLNNLKQQYKELLGKYSKQSSANVKYKQRISELQQALNSVKHIMSKKSERKDYTKLLELDSPTRKDRSVSNSLVMDHIPTDHLPKRMRGQRGVFL